MTPERLAEKRAIADVEAERNAAMRREQEAWAQVAVLLRAAIHGAYRTHPIARPDLCEDCKNAQAAVSGSYTEACALLDRLRRAEAVAEAAKRELAAAKECWPDSAADLDGTTIAKALAAWEEGTT